MKFGNYTVTTEMDTNIEIKQELCFLKMASTEPHSEPEETFGSDMYIKSESSPASDFTMETDSDKHGIDHAVDSDSNVHEVGTIKIKEEPRDLERVLIEQKSGSEDPLGSEAQVKSQLASLIVEPDSDIYGDDHKNVKIEIKEECGYLGRTTELISESEEINFKDALLHFDTKDKLSDGDQELLLSEPTRLDMGSMRNYECGIITADLDKSCLKLEENGNTCHVNTNAAHTGDNGDVNTSILHRLDMEPTRNYECDIITADLDKSCLKLEENSSDCQVNTSAAHTGDNRDALSSRTSHRCEFCSMYFNTASSLQIHIALHEDKRKQKCNICNKSFSDPCSLKRHSLTHGGKRPYKCSKCDKGFVTASHMKRHILVHEGIRFKCEKCNKSFTTSSSLRTHNLIHEGIQFKCHKCDKGFHRSSELKRHTLIHEGIRFKCDKCDKSFTTSSSLKKHSLIHEGILFKCEKCDKSFTESSSLRTHTLIHKGVQFKCQKCDKSFYRSSVLKKHTLVHEGIQFKCEKCDKSFNALSYLKKHSLIHGGKRYKCEKCDKSFSTSHYLKKHSLIHGGKQYKCEKCDKGFYRFDNLKKHNCKRQSFVKRV